MDREFTCVYCKQTVPFSPSAMRPHLTNPRPDAIAPSCMESQRPHSDAKACDDR